jgi:hypothetical protein
MLPEKFLPKQKKTTTVFFKRVMVLELF